MDVEGVERETLLGCRETIARWKPQLSVAAYHRTGDPVSYTHLDVYKRQAAGAATAFNLYQTGVITAAQATICVMPSMLMGTLVGHYARIVLVTETNKKYTLLMFLIPLFDAALGMILMRLILTAMGLM